MTRGVWEGAFDRMRPALARFILHPATSMVVSSPRPKAGPRMPLRDGHVPFGKDAASGTGRWVAFVKRSPPDHPPSRGLRISGARAERRSGLGASARFVARVQTPAVPVRYGQLPRAGASSMTNPPSAPDGVR